MADAIGHYKFYSEKRGDISLNADSIMSTWDELADEDAKLSYTGYSWTNWNGVPVDLNGIGIDPPNYTFVNSYGEPDNLSNYMHDGNLVLPASEISYASTAVAHYNTDKTNYDTEMSIWEKDNGRYQEAIRKYNEDRRRFNDLVSAYERYSEEYDIAYEAYRERMFEYNVALENWTPVGLAIGIYGDANTHIVNTGSIIIDGSKPAFGIYSAGGTVTNSGDIIIDGDSDHANAIKLNGGTLFQNGKFIVPGGSGVCPEGYGLDGSGNCTLKGQDYVGKYS